MLSAIIGRNLNMQTDISLREYSTMKVGGRARYLIEIKSKDALVEAIRFAKSKDLEILCVGGGSNILFGDQGFGGAVIKISTKGIAMKQDVDEVIVSSEAGEAWDDFVKDNLDKGYFGLENLSGIPGLVGAAPIQNIGAYGVEAGNLISEVEVFDTNNLEFKKMSASECKFGYRDSVFKNKDAKHLIVTSVTFKLSKIPNTNISYKDLANHFEGKDSPTPIEVREAVLSIRGKKFPDLKTHGTAGSFWKNVVCIAPVAERLKAEFPDLPVYDVMGGMKKISTAFILDKICGLKGFRIDDVGLYPNQSLVVVNYGDASASDIKDFILQIKNIVKQKIGIDLEEEVVVL